MIHEYDHDLTVYISFVMRQAQVVSLWKIFMKRIIYTKIQVTK